MSRTLPSVDMVVVGGGWSGSIIGKEMAAAGNRVVMLERGAPQWTSPDFQSPRIHDELRYNTRQHFVQNAAKETYTFRNNQDQTALPMRVLRFAIPATGLGGCGVVGRPLSL
jgi:gluconate 2-dehydrogenase alpha chain